MPSFKRVIAFETEEGNQYIMEFSPFNGLEGLVSIPVVDIGLVLTSSDQSYDSSKTLNKISNYVFEYLK